MCVMAFRFSSGSVSPRSASRNSARASTISTGMPISANISTTPLRLALAHQRVVDEDRPQPVTQGPVPQHGDHRAVHAAAQGVDGQPVADRCSNTDNLLLNESLIVHALLLISAKHNRLNHRNSS